MEKFFESKQKLRKSIITNKNNLFYLIKKEILSNIKNELLSKSVKKLKVIIKYFINVGIYK